MEKEYSEKNSGWNRINSPKTTFQIKEFDNKVHLINKLGEVYSVDPKGSLALLSLGALGQEAVDLAKKLNAEE